MNIFQSSQPTWLDRALLRVPQPSLLDRVWLSVRYPYDLVKKPIDILHSVPTVGFLLVPFFSSYSTSLNLLLFYLTWTTLILSHSPLKVELIGTLAIRSLFCILPSIGFLLFDSAVPSLAVKIKEHGDDALPLREEHGGIKGRWWKIALVSLGNILLGIALQAGIEILLTEVLHTRSALKVTHAIPMPWGVGVDLLRGLLLREVCPSRITPKPSALIHIALQILAYLFHRYALHNPSSPIHNQHLAWQHSVSAPYSLIANYDHPLPYIIHVFLPSYLPAVFFHFHLLTYHLYLAIISLEETFAYSGYNMLPSAFILGGIARRQERHLMGGGKGNFGCFGLMDLVMGTGLGEDVIEDIRDEAENKQVAQKVKGRARAAGRRTKKSRED